MFELVRIKRAGVIVGWALGILAFAFVVAWVERETGLSVGPALGVGASVALIWVTSTYVLATKQMADDQAKLIELQRKAPYKAALVKLWELSVRTMRVDAQVKSSFEHGATGSTSFNDAFSALNDARISADDMSLLASEYLAVAGSLDPETALGNLAADQSIALLKFSAEVMPAIAEAVGLLNARKSAGQTPQLLEVPQSFVTISDAMTKSSNEFSSAINDELADA